MPGLSISSGGFSISTASDVNGSRNLLNALGMTYIYIALKI